MIKFRQKNFTIPEGHYTGPKDMDKVPGALEIIGKSAMMGSGIGAIGGSILKDSTALSGAITGGKYGTIAGIILKFFINHLHNPMTNIKYQEVDKIIRREFGIYRAAGITVGDSIENRDKIEEKFGFNDRNITSYKLNFAIQDGSITLYTLNLTDKELDQVSKILDYYCKKYFGMEYTSSLINKKLNSYSVNIIFTNYQVISNFIMELSKKLNFKINLMDNKALVSTRISDSLSKLETEQDKTFSVKELDRYELLNLLSGNAIKYLPSGSGIKEGISNFIIGILISSLNKLATNDLIKLGSTNIKRKDLNNIYLESTLKKLGKVEGFNYTVGELNSKYNMSVRSGLFLLTVPENDVKKIKLIDDAFSKELSNNEIKKSNLSNVCIYTYGISSDLKFRLLLKKLIFTGIKFNIFEK